MRTVLIGSDFMYDKNGVLKPIEINTNSGWHHNKIENDDSTIDLTGLSHFITEKNFTKVILIGNVSILNNKLSTLCTELNIVYELIRTKPNDITIPYIEDEDTTLIIRISYDTTALVDETYCRDKVNFLNLIKDSSIGSEFAYMGEDGIIVNNITSINNNGEHPNFILKARLPHYDKTTHPKFYKVSTNEELNTLISNVVDSNYFLMEFLYNPTELYENHIKVYRGLNLLFPPNLESISLGGYTRLCDNSVEFDSTFDETTFELIGKRHKYISDDYRIKLPKLLATDLVQMGDDTYKTATDLVIGDVIKTIDIPNPFDVLKNNETANFKITLNELELGTTYSTNSITKIEQINTLSYVVKLSFTDGSDWFDNIGSKYLSIRNNEVRFLGLLDETIDVEFAITLGDNVLLLETSNIDTPTFITKEIVNIEIVQQFFSGYEITVENAHLFLTKSDVDSNKSYVSIEHNINESCYSGTIICEQSDCSKGEYCVQTFSTTPCGTAFFCDCQPNCSVDGGPSEF